MMIRKKSKPFEMMREESRNKILRSALKLFANDGFHQTSMEKIAKDANISKGLIYNYFASKNDLLQSIVLAGYSHNEELLIEIGKELLPQERLKLLINFIFDLFVSQKEFYQLYSSLIMQPSVLETSRKLLEQIYQSIFDVFEKVFEDLHYSNPKVEAKILGAVIDGIAIHYFFEQKEYPLTDVKNTLIQRYCREI